MENSAPARWLADCLRPLASAFGDRLSLQRDGNSARWTFDGQSVVVEMRPSGTIAATFVGRPSVDQVSARPAAGVYRAGAGYRPTPADCNRMISDMLAFFSGAREPRFAFADAYLLEA